MLLCSIPVVFLFLSGCYSASLALAIEKELDERKAAALKAPAVYKDLDANTCVSCEEQPKDSVFIPCGHMCLCSGCADKLKKGGYSQKCPICQSNVRDIVREYK